MTVPTPTDATTPLFVRREFSGARLEYFDDLSRATARRDELTAVGYDVGEAIAYPGGHNNPKYEEQSLYRLRFTDPPLLTKELHDRMYGGAPSA